MILLNLFITSAMNKLFLYIILVTLCINEYVYSQGVDTLDSHLCGTKPTHDSIVEKYPWFGNPYYLDSLLEAYGYTDFPASYSGKGKIVTKPYQIPSAKVRIPVKFWLHLDKAGTGGNRDLRLQEYIDYLNFYYSAGALNPGGFPSTISGINSRILFYQRNDTRYRFNDEDWHVSNDRKVRELARKWHNRACINVHIPMDFTQAGGTYYSMDPRTYFRKFIFVDLDPDKDGARASISTLAHEIGHALSLEHTHEHFDRGKCRQEPVDRGRDMPFRVGCPRKTGKVACSVTGDNFCDTNADPELARVRSDEVKSGGSSSLSEPVCTYTSTVYTDLYDKRYIEVPPDARNIMSYGRGLCRNRFSWNQIGAMVNESEKEKHEFGTSGEWDQQFYFDMYEPDDYPHTARNIGIDVIQHRSFHFHNYEYTPPGTDKRYDARDDDEDWVRFNISTPITSTPYRITTMEGHFDPANTIINVFTPSSSPATPPTWITGNDDYMPGSGFSRLEDLRLAPGDYVLRIEKKKPSDDKLRDYTLIVQECIPATLPCLAETVMAGETLRYASRNELVVGNCPDGFHIEPGGYAYLKSQTTIRLQDGFTAKYGSRATISPNATGLICNDNSTHLNIEFPRGKRAMSSPEDISQRFYPKDIFPGAKAYAKLMGYDAESIEQDSGMADPIFAPLPSDTILGLTESKVYPSPFSESFSLHFTIAADARVTVELCNALGQTIRTCCDNTSYAAGSHTLNIDGRGLAGGTYFAKILIDGAVVKTVPVMKVEN